jgi:uncharacterized membrane protein
LFPLVIALGVGQSGHAQQPFFMGLGDLPGGIFASRSTDISADGAVVVGYSTSQDDGELFRWTRETGMTGLGWRYGQPRLSADGSAFVGNFNLPCPCSSNETKWVRWTKDSGFEELPIVARAVSGDGSVVVGHVRDNNTSQQQIAFWTETSGIQTGWLGDAENHFGLDISADGNVILGSNNRGPVDSRYFTWSAAEGTTYWPAIGWQSDPPQISDNGKVVVGSDVFPNSFGAWRWTKETGAVQLGLLPDGKRPLYAHGVSADGSIIVGEGDVPRKSFIWDEVHGSRYLFDVLRSEYGLGEALTGWNEVMFHVRGVSGDGRTITGMGINPNGNVEAWIAYVGPATARVPGDYNYDGTVNAADYAVWRNMIGQSEAGLAADGNDDGVINTADYEVWRAHFGQTTAASSSGSKSESLTGVPEPKTFALTAPALIVFAIRRKRARAVLAALDHFPK